MKDNLLELALAALWRVSAPHTMTHPFTIEDNAEGLELKARMKYAKQMHDHVNSLVEQRK